LPDVSEKIKAAKPRKRNIEKKSFFRLAWKSRVEPVTVFCCCLLHVYAGLFFGQAQFCHIQFSANTPPFPKNE